MNPIGFRDGLPYIGLDRLRPRYNIAIIRNRFLNFL